MINKAQQYISGAKASAEFIFDQLDKLQKEKNSKDFSSKYADAKKALRAKLAQDDEVYNPVQEYDENYVLPRALVKGDTVFIKNLGTEGVLLSDPDKNGNVNIQAGILKTKTNIKNLILVTQNKKQDNQTKSKTKNVVSREFSISLDVRGQNIEEAWMDIDKYLDEAIICSVNSVTIVHGKGTGVLRRGLWEFFRKDKRIKNFRNGEYGEGDFGVTVIELKS